MTIHALTFVHPFWLAAGLLLAVAMVVLGARLDRKRRLALAAFSSRRNGPPSTLSRVRRAGKRALLVAGVFLGCTALARPQWGSRWQEAHRRGLDLLFALDTSKSMLAPDLKPDRLTRAKLAIRDLLARFDGHRAGLVAFAGDAFLQCPLTLDRGVFDQMLDAVDTTAIPRGGTDLGRAIDVARAALHNQPANRKLLVLLTDGEDLESRAIAAARAAAVDGIHIYTVGVGTTTGELVPLPGAAGQFVHDEKGGFVRSQLDESTLQAVAQVTGGEYRRLGADGRGLEALYQDVLAKLPQEELTSRMRQIPIERFQWPLGAAIVALAIEPLLGERRRRRREPEPAKYRPKLVQLRRRVVTLATLALMTTAASAQASPGDGERAYHEGKYKQSAEEYGRALTRSPHDAKLHYNLGVASYKSGDLAKAHESLRRSLRTDQLNLQENSYYDLGNVLYRMGQKNLAYLPEQTKGEWQQAISLYESALKLDPKDADAIHNRDLVKRKLAELDRQQQQNQQQQNQQQNGPPQNKSSGKSEQQSGQQGKQSAQNQQGQPDRQAAPKPSGQAGQTDQKNQKDQANQQAQRDQGQGQTQPTGEEKSAQARPEQQGQKKSPSPTAQTPPTTPQPSSAQPNGGDRQENAEPEVPGKLSQRDARQLLDAMRGDERVMPVGPENKQHRDDDEVRRDW
jgi:Ca-activated chloride channel family protein